MTPRGSRPQGRPARIREAPGGPGGGETGFGLAELLVAVTLVGIGMVAVGGGVLAAMRLDRVASSRTALTVAAESKVEELRAYARSESPDTVQLSIGGSLTASVTDHADTVGAVDGRIVRRWRVEVGPASTREVTLRVEPLSDRRRAVDSITVETLILIGG